MKKPYLLLKKAFESGKRSGLKLTLSELATRTGVSTGYMSKIFSGQKPLTPQLAESICSELRLDDLQKNQLINQLAQNLVEKKFKNKNEGLKFKRGKTVQLLNDMVLLGEESEWLLSKWYRLPMLDLITCDNFQLNSKYISQRLGLPEGDVVECLRSLKFYKFLSEDKDGNLIKTFNKLRFPSKFSKGIVRNYHEMQMKRAIQSMQKNITLADFNGRLITSLTVATDKKSLEKVKDLLHHALYEAAEILNEGECTEVYQLNLQLFPQTRS